MRSISHHLSMLFLLACAAAIPARAQVSAAFGADSVISFHPGEGSGAGYGAAYFPSNVLGLPDTTARAEVAAIDPRQILGLGLGGEIVLGFIDHPIVDGSGPDFTVFENPFYYTIGSTRRLYAEPGEVAVSRDGKTFVSFPFDSLTLRGCAGVTPTNGDRDPADASVSGGDSFDLHDLGLDTVRYVRIRDVTAIVKNNPSSPFWDVTLNGFDLDAVVVVNGGGVKTPASVDAEGGMGFSTDLLPNPVRSNGSLRIVTGHRGHLRVTLGGLLGERLRTLVDADVEAGVQWYRLPVEDLPSGAYFILIEEDGAPRGVRRVVIDR